MKLEGTYKKEPGGDHPVQDETELESYTDNNQPVKVESNAREDDDDDNAVTEASDSDDEPVVKTRSGRAVCVPKKYDEFEMTQCLLQLQPV